MLGKIGSDEIREKLVEIMHSVVSSMSFKFPDCFPKKLKLGSDLVGILCGGACIGDLVAHLPVRG